MKVSLCRCAMLFALILSVSPSRILAGKQPQTKTENDLYAKNLRKCNDPFLNLLLGKRSGQVTTDKVKGTCPELKTSCCSPDEVSALVKQLDNVKARMKPHLNQISDFLNYIGALSGDKLKEDFPFEANLDETKKEQLTTSVKNIPNDAKLTQSSIEDYFNTVLKTYSGLICEACDDRFGSFFFDRERGGRLIMSIDECNQGYSNEGKFMAFGGTLALLLKLANKLEPPTDSNLKLESFDALLKSVNQVIDDCKEKEEDAKLEATDAELVKDQKIEIDTNAETQADAIVKITPKKCEDYCRSMLPFAPFELPFDPYPVMEYLHKALSKKYPVSQYPPKPKIAPETFVVFQSVKGIDADKEISIEPNGIFFSMFPIEAKLYEIAEIKPVEPSKLNENDINPRTQLTFGQKLYNIFFGWLFGKYQ